MSHMDYDSYKSSIQINLYESYEYDSYESSIRMSFFKNNLKIKRRNSYRLIIRMSHMD